VTERDLSEEQLKRIRKLMDARFRGEKR